MVKREPCAPDPAALPAGATAPEDAPASPLAGSEDLLLWAVACGLSPVPDWHRATGVTRDQLSQLKQQRAPRLARFRLLRALGELLGRSELELLLRARVAEQLLADGGPNDLERIARTVERLPDGLSHPAPSQSSRPAEPADELAGMDLEAAIAEARQLLATLEESPNG